MTSRKRTFPTTDEIQDWVAAITAIDEVRETIRAFDAGELTLAEATWAIDGASRRAQVATLHARWPWFDQRAA